MRSLKPQMLQAIVVIAFFIIFHQLSFFCMGTFLRILGWSEMSRQRFLAELEPAIQVFGLFLSFFVSSLVERHFSRRPLVQWPKLHWISFRGWRLGATRGFLLASGLVALSLFFGISEVERPKVGFDHILWLLPWMIFQGALYFVWIFAIEWCRENLFVRILGKALPLPLALIMYVVFEGQMFFWIAQAHASLPLGFSGAGVCLIFSAALNLSYLDSLRGSILIRELFVERFAFGSAFLFSLFQIYGQNLSVWRGASLFQLYPKYSESAPLVLYALAALFFANTALQRLLSRRSLRP